MKLFNNISMVYREKFKCNINDTTMGSNNFYKHKYLQEMKCYCLLHECLANLIIQVLP